jgi:hypothetical protein
LNLNIFSWLYDLFTVVLGVSGGLLKADTESFLLLLWIRTTEFPDLLFDVSKVLIAEAEFYC